MGVSFSLARPKQKVSSIRAKISVSGASIFLYTGRSVETDHWDRKKCFVKSYVGKSTTTLLIQRLKELEIDILTLLDRYKQKVEDLILANIDIFSTSDHINLRIFYNFMRYIRNINPQILKLIELIFIRMLINNEQGKNFAYPTTFIEQNSFHEKIKDGSFSGLTGFLLKEGNLLIKEEVNDKRRDILNNESESD